MRQDPKQALIAQGVPQFPLGTLDEMEAANLPIELIPCCHNQSTVRGIKGCPVADLCTMSYKGKSLAEGGGPRNHAWERIYSATNGGAIVRNVHPCYWGVAQQDVVQENGEVLRTIADEGEEFEMLTTVSSPTTTDPFNREQKLLTVKVNAFKRPSENQKVAQTLLRASIAKKEQERVENERAAEHFGIEGAGVPLDKRGKGSGAGRKEKD